MSNGYHSLGSETVSGSVPVRAFCVFWWVCSWEVVFAGLFRTFGRRERPAWGFLKGLRLLGLDASKRLRAGWTRAGWFGWLRGFALGLKCKRWLFLYFLSVFIVSSSLNSVLKTFKFVSSHTLMSWFESYNKISGYRTNAGVKIGGKTLSCGGHSGFHAIWGSLYNQIGHTVLGYAEWACWKWLAQMWTRSTFLLNVFVRLFYRWLQARIKYCSFKVRIVLTHYIFLTGTDCKNCLSHGRRHFLTETLCLCRIKPTNLPPKWESREGRWIISASSRCWWYVVFSTLWHLDLHSLHDSPIGKYF